MHACAYVYLSVCVRYLYTNAFNARVFSTIYLFSLVYVCHRILVLVQPPLLLTANALLAVTL